MAVLAGIPQMACCDSLKFLPKISAFAFDEPVAQVSSLPLGRFTREFRATDGLGRSLGDSTKRGMSFDLRNGDAITDPLFEVISRGLPVGVTRTCVFGSNGLEPWTGGLLPPATSITVQVKIVDSKAP